MGQSKFYSKNYVGWPPVHLSQYANPDSLYWKRMAEQANNELNILFTADEVEAFANAWDVKCDSFTWREAFESWSRARELYQNGAGIVEILEELALLDGAS